MVFGQIDHEIGGRLRLFDTMQDIIASPTFARISPDDDGADHRLMASFLPDIPEEEMVPRRGIYS